MNKKTKIITGIASAGDVDILPMVIHATQNYSPMNADGQEALIDERKGFETIFSEEMN